MVKQKGYALVAALHGPVVRRRRAWYVELVTGAPSKRKSRVRSSGPFSVIEGPVRNSGPYELYYRRLPWSARPSPMIVARLSRWFRRHRA
jgi:hypothetical protein